MGRVGEWAEESWVLATAVTVPGSKQVQDWRAETEA